MVLARAWRRRLYASLGMAVVVPVALLASLTVLALNGGIPGLGSLREAVSGPSTPAAAPVLGSPAAGPRTGLRLRPSSPTPLPGVNSSATFITGSGPASGILGGSPGSSAPAGSPGSGGRGGGSVGGGGGGSSGSPQPSGGRPSPSPTPVDRVVGAVTPITSSLPAPVGPAATQTLKSGASVADRVLHRLPGQ